MLSGLFVRWSDRSKPDLSLKSRIVPQYSQNFSRVLKPGAEIKVLLIIMDTSRSLSQKAKTIALYLIEFYTETVERPDYKME